MLLVTGATGHTGRFVVRGLRKRFPDEVIRCLVRKTSDLEPLQEFTPEFAWGDLNSPDDVMAAMNGVRVVIHIANIRHSPSVVQAAIHARVAQVVLVHTTGMYSRYRGYASEYLGIESKVLEDLKLSPCRYTVLRPTMIYGGREDHNFHKLILLLNRVPVFPLFGSGSGKMQPVHVQDLASSIVNAVDNQRAYCKAFNISGGSAHSYREILQIVARHLGRRVVFIPLPFMFSLLCVWILNLIKVGPVSVEQVRRLAEDKVFSYEEAALCLDYVPRRLECGLWQQLSEMGINPTGRT